jgi:CubicO group peptidase (beta-lactamase class C family)
MTVAQTPTNEFDTALRQIDGWLIPSGVSGAGAAVWHGGKLVAERYAGEGRPGEPVGVETLFALASVSKPISAATVVSAIQDGFFGLDDPVAELLPEFNADDDLNAVPVLETMRPEITVRHLLAHISGLPEDVGVREVRYSEGPSLTQLTDAMCRLPLQSAPGEVLRYSNAGYAVLSRLVERHTGEEFWSRTKARILEPMGLDDVIARPTGDLLSRLVTVRDAANAGTELELYNSAYWRDLAIPWGGYFGTVRALASFAAAFLPAYAGVRSLSPASVAEMTIDQAGGIPGGVESGKVEWPVASWGLGWEVKGAKTRHWTGTVTSPETFCHFGQAGTLLWADPTRDLVLAIFTNRTVTRAWTFFLSRWTRLSDAVASVVRP